VTLARGISAENHGVDHRHRHEPYDQEPLERLLYKIFYLEIATIGRRDFARIVTAGWEHGAPPHILPKEDRLPGTAAISAPEV